MGLSFGGVVWIHKSVDEHVGRGIGAELQQF